MVRITDPYSTLADILLLVPLDDNETGSYLHRFLVPSDFQGQQIRLRFEGVDSSFHVWINGHEIGYSQGARNPSEFDITAHVSTEHENVLAVRVYKYCDGSYIEDQGMHHQPTSRDGLY